MNLSNVGGGASPVVKTVLNNIGRRYLVEHDEADDGSWWADRYSDGWVEQGGKTQAGTYDSPQTLTFPIGFRDSNYSITGSVVASEKQWTSCTVYFASNTPASISLISAHNGTFQYAYPISWIAQGYAA